MRGGKFRELARIRKLIGDISRLAIGFFLVYFVACDCAFGDCSEPGSPAALSPGGQQEYGSSVNDIGEVIWLELDPVSGFRQIYSSSRGQLTFEPVYRDSISLNNRGDIVWMQDGDVYGIISKQLRRLTYDGTHYQPKINDFQEIVTTRFDMALGFNQIHSSTRGQLTFEPVEHQEPSINNAGDVVWTQSDSSGWQQIYKLQAGAPAPVAVTSNSFNHSQPAISNSGEVVWAQGYGFNDTRIYSDIRGQLTGDCPYGLYHSAPSVNVCGDLAFTNFETQYLVYRLGNNSPCLTDPEPNNSMREAIDIVDGGMVTGVLDTVSGDVEDWYGFSAGAGARVEVDINWTAVQQAALTIDLIGEGGQVLATAAHAVGPTRLNTVALYSGRYYIRLTASGGRLGYNLYLMINLPPTVDAGVDQVVPPDSFVTLTGLANDPDGTIVSYKWTQTEGVPVTLSGEDSAVAAFTAPSFSSGALTFQLQVTDNRGAVSSDTVQVTVNVPPVAEAGPDLLEIAGALVVLNGSGTDLDGSVVAYSWVQTGGTPVTLSGASSAIASFTAPNVSGILTFRLTVTDDHGATAWDTMNVTVNLPPVANAGPDQIRRPKASVTLNGSGSSDPDGTIISYRWVQTQGTRVALAGSNTANASFTAPNTVETLVFQLTVTDNKGATAVDSATVVLSRK